MRSRGRWAIQQTSCGLTDALSTAETLRAGIAGYPFDPVGAVSAWWWPAN